MMRQVAGAFAEYEKARIVAKLKAARVRKREATGGKVEGLKLLAEPHPEVCVLARELRRKPRGRKRPSLRDVSAELAARGHFNANGVPYAAKSVNAMLAQSPPKRGRCGEPLVRDGARTADGRASGPSHARRGP